MSTENENLYSEYIVNTFLNAFLAVSAIIFNSVTIQALRKYSSLPKPLKTLLPSREKKRIIHGRAEIWNLSSSAHIDIERMSEANESDIECEHEKINFISPSVHVLFCLLYKHANNDVFDEFPKISDHFPKISEGFSKLFRRLDERLRTFSEDCRR